MSVISLGDQVTQQAALAQNINTAGGTLSLGQSVLSELGLDCADFRDAGAIAGRA